MRWVIIILIVFICVFLLIKPMYTKKGKKSKGPPYGPQQDGGGASKTTQDQ